MPRRSKRAPAKRADSAAAERRKSDSHWRLRAKLCRRLEAHEGEWSKIARAAGVHPMTVYRIADAAYTPLLRQSSLLKVKRVLDAIDEHLKPSGGKHGG